MKKLFIILFIILLTPYIYGKEKIIFLHTNDIHGHIFPYEDEKISTVSIGGFQYLAAIIKEEREKNPGRVILVDGGDFAQGSIWSCLDFGIPVIELMNILKYDCTVVGNHEFDWGTDKLEQMITKASFPVLSSNIVNLQDGNFIKGSSPYIIKELKGLRIGIIGFSSNDTSVVNYKAKNNYDFHGPEEILGSYIILLKSLHKVDIVVLLSHEGYEKDKEIAKNISGIDLIIGGHSHTVLNKPEKIENTIIVQAGCYLAYLGKLEIEYDKTEKKIIEYDDKLIKIDDTSIKPDSEVNSILENYRKKYETMANEVIGKTSVSLSNSKTKEANLGNLIADIIREYSKSDIGIINSGAIRENIEAGDITIEKIYSVFPIDATIVSMDLKGSDLIEIMESNFGGKHGILQISGLKAVYELKNPEGKRLIQITAGGKPINPDGIYHIGTTDFLSMGGSDFLGFKKGENKKDIANLRDSIIDYIKTKKIIHAEIEGRQITKE